MQQHDAIVKCFYRNFYVTTDSNETNEGVVKLFI